MNAATPAMAQRDAWDRHWDDYASAAERNPAQRFRRKLILSMLRDTGLGAGVPSARVLDIGSGQGDFVSDAAAAFPNAKLLGLELSASGVALAKRKVPGAAFVQWDLLTDRQPPDDQCGWATHADRKSVV